MFHALLLSIATLGSLSANGLVIDREGFGIDRAAVVFRDATGEVAHATTDENGRFTVTLPRTPTTWEASATGYQSKHLHFSDPLKLIATLSLHEPGFTQPVGSDDLGVLPYQDVGYALSLSPYQVLIGGSQVGVGDRGLGGSANVDMDNGTSVDAPAHYLSFVGVASASSSYGFSHGTSGRFDLGFDGPSTNLGTIGGGRLRLEGVQSRVGDAYVAFGTSTGDATTSTRADLVARTKIGKARVLFTAGSGSFDDMTSSPTALSQYTDAKLRLDLPIGGSRLRFEAATKSKSKTPIADYVENEASSDVQLLLSHTGGALSSEYGFEQSLSTGTRDYVGSHTKHYTGVVRGGRFFTSQQLTSGRLTATGSLASYTLSTVGTTRYTQANAQSAAGPTFGLSTQWDFDDHLRLQVAHAANEDSADASFYFGDPIPTLILDISQVNEATLSYRTRGGFVASATMVGERYVSYLGTTTLLGRGLSVDWPIDDRWRVRAWTFGLNDQSAAIPVGTLGPSRGRDVGWLTYYASPGVRFDAIYRRETDPIEFGRYLDSDAAFVLNRHVMLILTDERHATTSSFGLSLRFGSDAAK